MVEFVREQGTEKVVVVEFVNPNFKGVWNHLVDAAGRMLAKGGAVVHCDLPANLIASLCSTVSS